MLEVGVEDADGEPQPECAHASRLYQHWRRRARTATYPARKFLVVAAEDEDDEDDATAIAIEDCITPLPLLLPRLLQLPLSLSLSLPLLLLFLEAPRPVLGFSDMLYFITALVPSDTACW
jgi:hypothetical protein